jgi:hypothetical protein
LTDLPTPPAPGSSEIVLYQTEDGRTRLQVRLAGQSVWLSLNQIADLFQRDKSVVSKHIKNIFEERELPRDRVVAKFATTAADGKTYQVDYYNLDMVISVGYRVKSPRGVQFRVWATERLREYIIKGFALDDERLKAAGGGDYFDELLSRIRDIRSSERVFWRKVLDIYATSIDYDPSDEASQRFFATMQNKMHWATHGQTAAEVIHRRADATKPHMGLTSWTGARPRKTDVGIAKNFLSKDELESLNLIVSAYLDFAELQARGRRPMHMADWIAKLDDFLRLSERDILAHAGSISHEAAVAKAELEYDKFHALEGQTPTQVDQDFQKAIEAANEVKKIDAAKSKRKGKKL